MTQQRSRLAVIDHLDEDRATLLPDDDPDQPLRWPRHRLAPSAKEGDVVDLTTGRVDEEATRRRKTDLERTRARAFAGKQHKPGQF